MAADTPQQPANPIASIRNLFSIDARALGLLRIGLAGLVLLDLLSRVPHLRAHYTEFGVLPLWSTKYILSYQKLSWSLHWASDLWQWQAFLFAVAAVAAFAMLIGYKTRWATVITWALIASLHVRHPLILNGGDHMLRMFLFWSIFLPMGLRYSFDSRRAFSAATSKMVFSAATIAIMMQVCFLYWVSAATKTDPLWTENRWALYYALQLDQIATGFAHRMLEFPELLRWLTAATMWLEWFGPVLLFVPFCTARIRSVLIFLFAGFHFGIFLCMEIGLFPWICMVGWLAFLPSSVCDWLERSFGWGKTTRTPELATSNENAISSFYLPPTLVNTVVGGLLFYVLLFNLLVVYPKQMKWFDDKWMAVGYVFGLEQRFDIFAPKPTIIDGWFVAVATLEDGSQVDLVRDGQPVIWDKPENLSKRYANGNWGAYLFFLKTPKQAATNHRPYYIAYLKRLWQERHGDRGRIKTIELYIVLEETLPYPRIPEQRPILLYRDIPEYERVEYFIPQTD